MAVDPGVIRHDVLSHSLASSRAALVFSLSRSVVRSTLSVSGLSEWGIAELVWFPSCSKHVTVQSQRLTSYIPSR